MHRVPIIGETGLQVFFNGPESFTPDDRYQLGEAPELQNYFVAAGFNSVGIQSAGGAGKVLLNGYKKVMRHKIYGMWISGAICLFREHSATYTSAPAKLWAYCMKRITHSNNSERRVAYDARYCMIN